MTGVYYATNRFPGDADETQFEVAFDGGYIAQAHIKVYIEDDTSKVRDLDVEITEFVNANTVVVSKPAPVGSTMVIYRDTPKDAPLVDFQNRSRMTEKNFDTLAQQAVFLAAEAADATNQDAINNLLTAAAQATAAAESAEATLAATLVVQDAVDDALVDAEAAEDGAVTAQGAAVVAQLAAEAALAAQQAFNLAIGTVSDTTGSASATITGTYPNKSLNLVLKQGIQGIQGVQGIQGPAGNMSGANNLSELTNTATARSNLGLGTAAVLNVGAAATNVAQVATGGRIVPSVYLPLIPSVRTSNTILAVADFNSIVRGTGTWTQTLTAAATLGSGWFVTFKNANVLAGVITIDPNSTETIDGQATINLYPGESCTIWTDGTAFYTEGLSTGQIAIEQFTMANTVSKSFLSGFSGEFYKLQWDFVQLRPTTNDQPLNCRVSEDGGSTWKQGASDYAYSYTLVQGATPSDGAVTTTQFGINAQVTNVVADGGLVGSFYMYDPSSAVHTKEAHWNGAAQRSATGPSIVSAGGRYVGSNNAVNGAQFYFASNALDGMIIQYGYRKRV